MGCDIHIVVERRQGPGKQWERVQPTVEIDGRNYRTFAILADVRNYDGVPPISEPRGFPDDFTPQGRDGWIDDLDAASNPDLHSISWLTLADLEAYPWDRTARQEIITDEKNYRQWRQGPRDEHPRWGFRGTSEPVVTEEEYAVIERVGAKPPHGRGWCVRISWDEPLRSIGGELYDTIMPWLRTLGAPEDVRLVFGFDN